MGSAEGLVEIRPRDQLQFLFEVNRQSSRLVHLVNKTDEHVAFKVKTTSPKRYCVRPNFGVILPKATCVFTVHMQAQMTAPINDKFLVLTTAIPVGTTTDEVTISAIFSKETRRYVEENKLRVVLVSASEPEAEQLISGIPNVNTAIEVPVAEETLNIVNEVPNVVNQVPHSLTVEDVENMKSKLTDLEVKLEQDEILIIQLREEARTSIQTLDKLQHQMDKVEALACYLEVQKKKLEIEAYLIKAKENRVKLAMMVEENRVKLAVMREEIQINMADVSIMDP